MAMSIAEPPRFIRLPTHLDLPHTDDKPVENAYQPLQSAMLTGILTPVLDILHPTGNYFIGSDCGIYWRLDPDPLTGCKVPDWYYVPGVPRLLNGTYRRSYVMWQEYARPLIVIEYISGDGSEERDRTPGHGKFWVYEHGIQSRYYALHDPDRESLELFELVRGEYQPVVPNEHGRFPIPEMDIEFGVWEGEYAGYPGAWLRVWDRKGRLLPTLEETAEGAKRRAEAEKQRAEAEKQRAEAEKQRAEAEKQRAEAEKQRADKLAAKLRELGIDPNTV